ncbi:MAG: serpin family protein [Roseburia sp.]|nr:serpin family protein [Roseburia sp.]
MKKSFIALLLCGVMAAGCGRNTDVGAAIPGTTVLIGEQGKTGEGERKEADKGGDRETEGEKEADKGRDGETEEGKAEKMEPDSVEVRNAYEKAAYLADRVYQENGAGNTMISPLSLDMALGLVSGGAAGKTREELLSYLGKEDYGAFASEYMEYAEQMNRDYSGEWRGGYKTVFEIANSVWLKDDRELLADYADKVREQFRAEIASVSFRPENRKQTVERINGWCNEKTHGLIPSIITEDSIRENLAAILVNSLYFESPWAKSWGLTEHSFTAMDGEESSQEMLTDALSVYYENEYATAFSKNYINGLLFVGILPKEEGEFQISDLDLGTLLKSRTTEYDVSALMPKLDFETTADNIIPILQAQGVRTPFDTQEADFTRLIQMKSDEVTYISDIIQKCKIELDEDGTRAAAVTAVMMEMRCAMETPVERECKEVYLDRPFAFMIYDSEKDQILFLGKVVEL